MDPTLAKVLEGAAEAVGSIILVSAGWLLALWQQRRAWGRSHYLQ
jgi:hypothetical protein